MRVLCVVALVVVALGVAESKMVTSVQDITFEFIELSPGVNLYYHLPPSTATTGLVWIMHPRGSNAIGWLNSLNMNEMTSMLPTLINLGYGIIAPDSANRGQFSPFYPAWSIPPWTFTAWADNLDVQNMFRGIDFVTSRGLLNADTPLYSMGMSQGCDIMPLLGSITPLSAVVCQSGNGGFIDGLGFAGVGVPTLFMLGTNATGGDGANEDRPGLQEAAIAQLAVSNVPVQQMRIPVTRPVTVGEILRIPWMTPADAEELLGVLRAQACVDDQDYQYESPPWENGCKDFGRWNVDGRADIDSILRDCFGGNAMAHDTAPYIIAWFKDHQARVGTPCAPNCPSP